MYEVDSVRVIDSAEQERVSMALEQIERAYHHFYQSVPLVETAIRADLDERHRRLMRSANDISQLLQCADSSSCSKAWDIARQLQIFVVNKVTLSLLFSKFEVPLRETILQALNKYDACISQFVEAIFRLKNRSSREDFG